MSKDRGDVPARARIGALAPSRCGSTQNMASNIKVAVRVRPLNDREHGVNSRVVVDVVDEKMLVFDPKEEVNPFHYRGVQQPNKNFLKRANKELKFVFDNVCGQDASNEDVFETTTKDMLASLMEGYNCSVFAYGATGAGKTFTMTGNIDHPGITYLTTEHLFYTIHSFEHERDFDIAVSYIEVYNENVYDLLKPSKTPLQLCEDHYGVMVAGLSLHSIKTARELLQMLESGYRMRTQHPTDANAESSRSHAVFQVYIKMRYKTSSQIRLVKLSMIDLAGSERAAATGCVGARFKEGANINKSLLYLGNCINKLADGSSYIPYRDSKLTRLLKDSLGGNCKTVMIANVSPSSLSYEDTYNTLKYAARANKIQLSIKKNIVDGDVKLSQSNKIQLSIKKNIVDGDVKLSQSNKIQLSIKKNIVDGDVKLSQSNKIQLSIKKNIVDGDVRLSQFVNINEELKEKVKELEAKLSLWTVKVVLANDKAKQEWRRRLLSAEEQHSKIESKLLSLMHNARVLAMKRRRNTHGVARVLHMALQGSAQAGIHTSTEEELGDEQAAKDYLNQAVTLDTKITAIWPEWDKSRNNLNHICQAALAQCPDLAELVDHIQTRSKLRQTEVSNDTRYKIGVIRIEETTKFTSFVSNMTEMLKKLFFTMKGYDHLTPALHEEYLELQKQAKSSRHVTWFDEEAQLDAQCKFIYNMDIEQPLTGVKLTTTNGDAMVDIVTDSEDLTDIENKEPVRLVAKRKGTPIKLANDETIIIDDSFENSDTTRNLNSAKKVKRELELTSETENYGVLDPKDLNSTFVLAGKMNPIKKTVKSDKEEPKRGLADNSNMPQRTVSFNSDRAKTAKPLVAKALPFRRPTTAPATRSAALGSSIARPPRFGASVARQPGFGSSVSRDGTPL